MSQNNNLNLNATKHSRERWTLRVDQEADPNNIDKQIINAVNKSEHIWQDQEGIDFYIDDNYIEYVCDLKRMTIITLFPVDWGFPEDINNEIAEGLLKKIREQKVIVDAIKLKQSNIKSKNDIERGKIKSEINILQEQIKQLECQIRKLDNNDQEVDLEVSVATKCFEDLAYKLTYSKNYKMEKLSNK